MLSILRNTTLALAGALMLLAGCAAPTSTKNTPTEPVKTPWARSVSTGTDWSEFTAVAQDRSGNTYSIGWLSGSGTYTFGTGVTATGANDDSSTAVVVKYNSSGTAQWARTVSTGSPETYFYAVTADASGNVYAAGYVTGAVAFDFGDGVSVTGDYDDANAVLVKYDTNGTALWAKTILGGESASYMLGVKADRFGNVYAAGYFIGVGTFTFGEDVAATGAYGGHNAFVVKYNSSGEAQWVQNPSEAASTNEFSAVTTDSSGNVYAAGYIGGTESYTFGTGVSVTGTAAANLLLVKYNSSGTALWAKTVTSGPSYSYFYAVATDGSGNVYAVGTVRGTSTYDFGGSATAAGPVTNMNAVLVKYDSDGTGKWARAATAASSYSTLLGVATDGSGNVYAAGYLPGTGFTFGEGVTNTAAGGVVIKYDTSGTAQWAKSGGSQFAGITTDTSGRIAAAGYIEGTSSYDFGTSGTAAGSVDGHNVVVVQYE